MAKPTQNQHTNRSLDQKKSPSTFKHKDFVAKTLDQAAQYSPDFNLKKINHYDNTIKNVPRKVLENYDLKKPFRRETLNKVVAEKEEPASFVNLGSSFGPGGRAVLYAAVPKKDQPIGVAKSASGDLKEHDYLSTNNPPKAFKEWQHYDTNMNNQLVHHKKVVNSKLYELDSRAQALSKYGYQPMFENHLEKKRNVEGVLLEQTMGKSNEERLP